LDKKETEDRLKPKQDEIKDQELMERQQRLKELRDKLKAKDAEMSTPRTPRSKELFSELNNFRPKTASNFRPDF
jgi:hypothetical protein